MDWAWSRNFWSDDSNSSHRSCQPESDIGSWTSLGAEYDIQVSNPQLIPLWMSESERREWPEGVDPKVVDSAWDEVDMSDIIEYLEGGAEFKLRGFSSGVTEFSTWPPISGFDSSKLLSNRWYRISKFPFGFGDNKGWFPFGVFDPLLFTPCEGSMMELRLGRCVTGLTSILSANASNWLDNSNNWDSLGSDRMEYLSDIRFPEAILDT